MKIQSSITCVLECALIRKLVNIPKFGVRMLKTLFNKWKFLSKSRTDKVRSTSGDKTSEEVESLWNPKYCQSTNRQRLPFSVKVLSSSEASSLMSLKITRQHIINLSADSSLSSTHIILLGKRMHWACLQCHKWKTVTALTQRITINKWFPLISAPSLISNPY